MHLPNAESDPCSCGVALESRLGRAYNEKAFRYFLAIERRRSERSGRPVGLLLVALKEQPGVSGHIDSIVARKLFGGLWLCLRETDIFGWYREQHVAGALLIGLGDGPQTEVSRRVGQRVTRALSEGLPGGVARRLQVRVYQHADPERIDSSGGFDTVLYRDLAYWPRAVRTVAMALGRLGLRLR